MNLVFYGQPVELGYNQTAGQVNGHAAIKQEEKKLENYKCELLLDGSKLVLVPLVLSILAIGVSLYSYFE